MSARFFNALGASDLRADDLRERRERRGCGDPRRLAGGRSRALAAGALRPVLGLEPDVDRAAPVAADPRGPPCRREARRRRPVPQPHRAGGRRASAAPPGHGRRARAGHDARDRRRRPAGRARGAGPTRRATRSCSDASRAYPVEHCSELCGVPAETIARIGCEFASTQPSLLRLGVGAQRHLGAPIAYRTLACLPALAGSWRHEGGGASYIPTATIAAAIGRRRRAAAARPAARAGARHQHVAARRRADSIPPSIRR